MDVRGAASGFRSPFSPRRLPPSGVRTRKVPRPRPPSGRKYRTPASDTHTHQHTQSSAPLDQPSSKTEVRTSSNKSAKRLPQQGSVASETPASHGKVKQGALVSPQKAFGPPGELPQLKGGDVRHRPQPQTRRAPPGGSERPARCRRASLSRPATPLSPRGPPSGAPPPPPPRAGRRPPRPLLAASPHPTRPAAALTRPPPAGRRAAPPSRGAPRAPLPSGAAPAPAPPSPHPVLSPRRSPLGPHRPPPAEPCRPRPHPVSGECGRARTRRSQGPPPALRAARATPSADSPGHPRTDPHTRYYENQAPARPELVQLAARAHCPTAHLCSSARLASPLPLPLAPLFGVSLQVLSQG